MDYKNIARTMRRTEGYTLDQTILIIAIIAILVTIVILTVGWSLINRASGARLASQLGNVEAAIGNHYGDLKYWPIAATAGPSSNALALAGVGSATPPGNTKNYIGGLGINGTSNVYHNLTSGLAVGNRRVMMLNKTNPWGLGASTSYMVIQFQGINYTDFQEADSAIDSNDGGAAGRVRAIAVSTGGIADGAGCFITTAPTAAATSTVDVCYLANNTQ